MSFINNLENILHRLSNDCFAECGSHGIIKIIISDYLYNRIKLDAPNICYDERLHTHITMQTESGRIILEKERHEIDS